MSHAEGGYVTTGATREHRGYLFYAEAGANPEDPTEWIQLGYTADDGFSYTEEAAEPEPMNMLDSAQRIAAVVWRVSEVTYANLMAAFNGGVIHERPKRWPPGGETLAAIDDTLDGRCACGCGRKLGNSPSAWFYGQDCQMRWQRRQAVPLDDGWE